MTEIVNEAVIKVVADASGVEAGLRPVDNAVAKTGKNLENLGATARKTGKIIEDVGSGPGLGGVGDSAGTAATQVDRATKSMADSIRRATQATAALSAGAKGTAENFAALASARGLNMDTLKPYLAQLDEVTRKTSMAAEAKRRLETSDNFLNGLRAQAEGIGKTALQLAALRAEELGVADAARPLIEQLQAAEEAAGNAGGSIDGFAAAMASIGIGGTIATIAQISDEYSKYTSQLKLATIGQSEFANAQTSVRRIATSAQSDLSATGSLYASITKSTRDLGIAQAQVSNITEVVSLALKVSGASSEEASSAILQLSQAFAAGALRGDEFNSVNEAAPRLMQALADGLGVPAGALRKMAEDGALTTSVLAEALPRALGALRNEAASVQTIGGSVAVLKNNVMELVGATAQSNGVVAVLSGGIKLLSDNLVLAGGAMATVVAVKLGSSLATMAKGALDNVAAGRALAATNLATAQSNVAATAAASATAAARVNELRAAVAAADGNVALAITTNGLIPAQARATAAAAAHTAALSAQATAAAAASTSATLARSALALIGGPVGAVIAVLGIAATAWAVWGNKAEEANDKAAASTEETTRDMITRLDQQIEKLRERNELAKSEPRIASFDGITEADKDGLARAKAALDAVRKGTGEWANQSITMRQLAEIDLLHDYELALKRVTEKQKEVEIATGRTRAQQIDDWYAQNGTAAQRLAAELEKLKKQFGTIPAEMEKLVRAKYVDSAVTKSISDQAKAAKEYADLLDRINGKDLGLDPEFQGNLSKLFAGYKAGKQSLQEYVATVEAYIGQQPFAKKVEEDRLQAIEDLSKFQERYSKGLEATSDIYDKAIKDAEDEAARNEEAARTYGLSKTKIEELTLARLEDQLAQRASLGLTLDEISMLEKVIDAKKRTVAALGNMEEIDAQKKAWDSIEQTAHDTFVSIFDSGKSAFDRLRDTLKNGLLDLLYQMTIKKWIFNIGASVTGGATGVASAATSAAGSAGSSMLSNALGISSAMSGFGGFAATGFMNTIAGTGLSASLSAGGALLANGAIANGLGMIAGALGPIALGIGAAVAVWKKLDTSGTIHTGGAASATSSGITAVTAKSLGMENINSSTATQTMVGQLAQGIVGILDATALTFGKTAGYQAATAFADDTSKDGAWGSLVISKLGQSIVNWQDTRGNGKWAPKTFADGEKGQQEYLAAMAASVRTALNQIGLPAWATKMLDDLGQGATIEQLGEVVTRINETQQALVAMRTQLTGFDKLSDTAVTAMMQAAGGIENLYSSASSYYANFYSDAEKSASIGRQLEGAFSSLNLAMPTSRAEFRALVEQQMALGESGAPAVAALLSMNAAVAELYPLADAAADSVKSAADILSERTSLQDQLDQLTMTSTQLLKKQRDALAEANRPLFDMIQAAQKLTDTSSGLTTFRDSLRSLSDSLVTGSLSILTPEQQYAELRSQYEKTRAAAFGGDTKAQDSYSSVLTAFLTASQKINGGDSQYQADFAMGVQDSTSMASWASGQIDAAQKQLNAMGTTNAALDTANKILDTIAQNTTPAVASGFVLNNAFAALAAAVKSLQKSNDGLKEEVAGLRSDQQAQTGDTITSNAEVQQSAAQTIVTGLASTLVRAVTSNQKVTLE